MPVTRHRAVGITNPSWLALSRRVMVFLEAVVLRLCVARAQTRRL
ncbi:MAG TPA: hypothetical protein VHF25_07765 [Nitriliruptorales bacterium]|nr:hypothetical protein [Nitriliruptorales bacterium]